MLLRIVDDYDEYIRSHPDTLLPRFYGTLDQHRVNYLFPDSLKDPKNWNPIRIPWFPQCSTGFIWWVPCVGFFGCLDFLAEPANVSAPASREHNLPFTMLISSSRGLQGVRFRMFGFECRV